MKSIVKFVARWILRNYTGKLVGATLDMAADKAKDSERIQRICKWTAAASSSLAAYAVVLEDGKLTTEERNAVVAEFNALAEELNQLLSE